MVSDDDLAIREKIYHEARDCIVIAKEVQQWAGHGEIDYEEIKSKLDGISEICFMLCSDIREYEAELAREER